MRDRLGDRSQVIQVRAAQTRELESIGRVRSDGQAALGKRQRPVAMKESTLDFGGVAIRARRGRIIGPVEMLGVQHRIALAKPVCRTTMQLTSPRLQQRRVDTLLDQRVGKQKSGTFGKHERVGDERTAIVVRIRQQFT